MHWHCFASNLAIYMYGDLKHKISKITNKNEVIATDERHSLWREKMSRDQGSPSIILCTGVKSPKITLL